jgi:hypothetical protein
VGLSSTLIYERPVFRGESIQGAPFQFYVLRASHTYELNVKLRPTLRLPRMSGAFVLDATSGCVPGGDPRKAEHTYEDLQLTLPDNRGSLFIPSLGLYAPCQLDESALGWAKGFTFVTESP